MTKFFEKFLGQTLTQTTAAEIFANFDSNKDDALDKKEMRALVDSLTTGQAATSGQFDAIFDFLDADRDGVVSRREFTDRGVKWLNIVLSAPVAFLVVDVQNDFIDGSLALRNYPAGEDGADVVPVVNQIVDRCGKVFRLVVCSLDWHPPDHISFAANVANRRLSDKSKVKRADQVKEGDTVVLETKSYGPVEQYMWPVHCVQNSEGAKLHAKLKLPASHVTVYKGTDPDIDSYSAFFDNGKRKKTELHDTLAASGIRDVVVCGLATDVCVGATAAHSQELGFRTALVSDASRGVTREGIDKTKKEIQKNNGLVIESGVIDALASKRMRPAAWVTAAAESAKKF